MEKHDMGLGETGKPGLVFVRQFRFICKAEHLNEWMVLGVEVDLKEKFLVLKIYEAVDNGKINAHEWADAMQQGEHPKETITLLAVDGCGNELYTRTFSGLKLTGRKNNFHYENNDVCLTEVVISYRWMEYTGPTQLKHEWKENRERTAEINHLNGKSWVS